MQVQRACLKMALRALVTHRAWNARSTHAAPTLAELRTGLAAFAIRRVPLRDFISLTKKLDMTGRSQ